MGLKRRNPARTRLLTAPEMVAIMATSQAPAENEPTVTPVKPAEAKQVEAKQVEAKQVEVKQVEAPVTARPVARAITNDERHRMIARTAYGYAERAGFASDPIQNWLLAERDVDAQVARAS